MFSKTALFVATLLLGSTCIASAATYNISITGACDTLTLTVNDGVVVGQSNSSGCDDGNEVGYVANVKELTGNPGTNELIVGSDLGLAPDAWTWTFNLKTKTATLTGTPDGSTVYGPDNFSFTYAKAEKNEKSSLPSATSIAASNQH